MLRLAPAPTPIDTRPDLAAEPAAASGTALSTTALVESARAHDGAAWRELVGRYELLVRRTVAGYRLREADADDAVQNTWLRAFEHLATVDDPERLGGWLRTTARRESIKVARQVRREGPADLDLETLADGGKGPEAAALGDESRAVVAAALERLPERRRQLIRALFYRPDAGYAELAREMGLPVGSIGPTRRRALRTLRSELGRSGYVEDRAPA